MIDPNSPNRDEEVRALFARSLEAVRLAFVAGYRLTEEEADEATDVLYGWFYRLNSRIGSSSRSPALHGETIQLVASACQLGREFQLWKLEGQPCQDEGLSKNLARDPQQVALEIVSKILEEKQ